jgi:hypothetical protein
MNDFLSTLGLIVLVILVIALAGFLNIWALNTLFPVLAIPFNIWTWLASMILFANFARIKKDKE